MGLARFGFLGAAFGFALGLEARGWMLPPERGAGLLAVGTLTVGVLTLPLDGLALIRGPAITRP